MRKCLIVLTSSLCMTLGLAGGSLAEPRYDQGRQELEWVMQRLIEWLPGEWDSFPQVWYERNVRAPSQDGEHEHWFRTFARIDAPQVGDVVFYGQINVHGPNGPIMAGSQVLYKAVIDERLGAVNIFGQGPLNPGDYEDLHKRPQLWSEVRMRDPDSINCDWLWRRDGNQLFGVLQGNTVDKQAYGPGTCSFVSKRTDAEFRADAEWVLTPEQLWLYDNNWSGGFLFLGREDQTHIRLHRVRRYACNIADADGQRRVDAYDRGFDTIVKAADGKMLSLMLLRAEYPGRENVGLEDRLRLLLEGDATGAMIAAADESPKAAVIALKAHGIEAECRLR